MKNILNNLAGNIKKNFEIVIIILLSIIFGIFIALNFRAIKYTEFLDPKIVDIDPRIAYDNIINQKVDGKNNKILLIDVRSKTEYDRAHASSSINLPIHYMYDDTHGIKNELSIPLPKNTDQEIYLLCSGGRLAGVAYGYLEHYGYRNIKRIEGGISNWAKEGLPVIAKDVFELSEKEYNPLDKPYVNQK